MSPVSKAPVAPGLRPGYDLPATGKCWNRGQIVERMYDWSQRSCVIARAKSVAARSWSCSKPGHTWITTRLRRSCDREMLQSWAKRRKNAMFKTCNLLFQIVSGRTISRATGRVTLRPVVPPIDCSLTQNKCGDVSGVQVTPHMTPDPIGRSIPRLIVRSIVGGHD